jgi:hypothetical protein
MMRAESGSRIFLSGAGSMFAFDGGTAGMNRSKQDYYIFEAGSASVIISEGSLAYDAATQGGTDSTTRTITDARATTPTNIQRIMTRSPSTPNNRYLRGATATPRTWLGDQSGTEHNYVPAITNVGGPSGFVGLVGNATNTSGLTLSVKFIKNGYASN